MPANGVNVNTSRPVALAPDFQQLLGHLWRGGEFGAICTETTARKRHTFWYEVGAKVAMPAGKKHVWFGVNPSSAIPPTNAFGVPTAPAYVRPQHDYIAGLNCFFAEFDAKDFAEGKAGALAHIQSLPSQPSVIIESGGGYHCYWFLTDTVYLESEEDRDTARAVQHGWVAHVGGDQGAKNLNRVLRLPGSRNYKAKYAPDYPTVEIIQADYTRLYTLDELRQQIPVIPPTRHQREAQAPRMIRAATPYEGDSVIAAYNARFCIRERLAGLGYIAVGERMIRPGADESSTPGVVFTQAPEGHLLSFHHSGNDRLANGFWRDAFSVFEEVDHGGDTHKAVKAAAALLEMDTPEAHKAWQLRMIAEARGERADHGANGSDNQDASENVDPDQDASELLDFLDFDGILAELATLKPEGGTADREAVEDKALALAEDCARLSPLQILKVAKQLEKLGARSVFVREWRATIREMTAEVVSDDTENHIPSKMSGDILRALRRGGYTFRLNEVNDDVEVNGTPIDDPLRAEIRTFMRDRNFTGMEAVEDAYTTHARANSYHPIKEYLESLKWDGENHIGLLADYITCTDDQITYNDSGAAVSLNVHYVWLRRWLIGAVAKVMEGTQNAMLVFNGPQGIGKSTLVRWLCPIPGYFIEESINTDDKDSQKRLMEKWVWEVPELGATTRRSDREALKHFISQQTVTIRKAYGRHDTRKPAMASLFGTLNAEGGFLNDPTGSRRFLVCKVTKINQKYTEEMDVAQIWAQAFALWREGESYRLSGVEAQRQKEINDGYSQETGFAWFFHEAVTVTREESDWVATGAIMERLTELRYHANPTAMQMELSRFATEMELEKRKKANEEDKRVWGYVGLRLKPAPTIKAGRA